MRNECILTRNQTVRQNNRNKVEKSDLNRVSRKAQIE